MASRNEKRSYPPRLYDEGKSPIQRRSMHHNCQLSWFGMMRDCIGEKLYNEIANNSKVGVLLKLADSGYVWCAKHVHYLLTHQLYVERRHEIWFLVEGSPLRFSLNEFSEITGLNCDTINTNESLEVNHRELWGLLKVDASVGPNWDELVEGLRHCRTWDADYRKQVALLFILHVGIEGKSRSTRLPLEYAKTVLNEEAFERFPWDRVGFKSLIDSIKVVALGNDTYTIHGCVHALYIWAFEHIPALGEKHGRKKDVDSVPLLRWDGGRKRYNLIEFLAAEKMLNGKLEVKHMVPKPVEDIYPVWPDENVPFGEGKGGYKVLDNLVHDILNNCLDESGVWEVANDGDENKKKKKRVSVEETEVDFVDSPPLKKKTERIRRSGKEPMNVGQKSKSLRDEEEQCGQSEGVMGGMNDRELGFEGLLKLIGVLSEQIVAMDTKLAGRLDGLESKVTSIDTKLGVIENDVDVLKRGQNEKEDDAQSNNGDDGASQGRNESWLHQMKETSEGFPVSVVLRNRKSKVKENGEAHVGFGRAIKTEPVDGIKSEERKRDGPILVDLTKDEKTPINKMKTSGYSDPIESAEEKAFSIALDKLLKIATKDDFVPKKRRCMNLAANQLDPYIGSSIVKRIMNGVVLSERAYDPFAKANSAKVDKLMAFIKDELDNPLDKTMGAANFYLRIMTPKEMWPRNDKKYGWLGDSHLASGMHLLRKRSMEPITPFVIKKVAFLDPWFVNQWQHDYKEFEKTKNWIFPDEYFNVYKGKSPRYSMTNWRWVADVQFVFLIHNIENMHWIAVQVDLKNKKVNAYDSAIGFRTDSEVEESCKPYTRMIPALMQAVAPQAEKKKIGRAAFKFYRFKTAPQNYQEGDCGVYALKYIECLALGLNFIGLSDDAMPVIRLKLGAEIFDEVPDTECFIQVSAPNPRAAEHGQVKFSSETKK